MPTKNLGLQPTYPSVLCTVDVVLLCLQQRKLCVGLHKREVSPFEGVLALPGGYVHAQEDQSTLETAARVLREKLGVAMPYLEQVATFSGLARDPRGWSLSVVYAALVPLEVVVPSKGTLTLVDVGQLPPLPFDHAAIVAATVERVRNKSWYSSLPVHLCGETFTLPELQDVYETILGEGVNKVSFRRKMAELNLVEAIDGELTHGKANRPAQLYRVRPEYRRNLALLDRGLGLGK